MEHSELTPVGSVLATRSMLRKRQGDLLSKKAAKDLLKQRLVDSITDEVIDSIEDAVACVRDETNEISGVGEELIEYKEFVIMLDVSLAENFTE